MISSEKIENPRTELSNKGKATDEDTLDTMLSNERNLCASYTTAMQSTSNEDFHSLLFDMLKDTSQQYRKLFDLQFQHGWNSFTPVALKEIKAVEQKFNELKQKLK